MAAAADEMMEVRNSKHYERFLRAVESAVGQDRLTGSPEYQGYNGDPSSEGGYWGGYNIHDLDANFTNYIGYTDYR